MWETHEEEAGGRTSGENRTRRVGRRLAASALDMVVVVAWAAVAAVTGLIVRAVGLDIATPSGWDFLAFLTLVLPVIVTLAVMEAGPAAASFGKRRLGLVVVDVRGQRIGVGRSLLRSGSKFAPWQIGHTGVFHLAAGEPEVVWMILAVGAQVLALASVALMAFTTSQRALHDWLAGTRVVAASHMNDH